MPIDITTLTLAEILDLKRQLSRITISGEPRNPRGAPLKHDYASWDWTKRDCDLCREHHVGPGLVSLMRRKLGHPKVTKHYPACLAWDWTKTNVDIAREQGVEITIVRQYRLILNKPAVDREPTDELHVAPIKDHDWDAQDWTRRDVDIARDLGVTRERVRQVRAKRGLTPKRQYIDRYAEFLKAVNGAKSLSFREAKQMGVKISAFTFPRYCTRAGIERHRNDDPRIKYPWNQMNWDLPNILLREIWGVGGFNLLATHRSNHLKPKPAFRSMRGRIPIEFQPIVDAEKVKAQQWRTAKNETEIPINPTLLPARHEAAQGQVGSSAPPIVQRSSSQQTPRLAEGMDCGATGEQ